MLGDVNKLFVFKSLLTRPCNVLPLHLKQTFPFMIWIFTEGEGDGIKSRLHFKIFSSLPILSRWNQLSSGMICYEISCPPKWCHWKIWSYQWSGFMLKKCIISCQLTIGTDLVKSFQLPGPPVLIKVHSCSFMIPALISGCKP